MNLVDAVRVTALASVIYPDSEYLLRHIFRVYSETFHTPLHIVYELPIDEVLMHYYEHKFEQMDEHERKDWVARVLETEEQRKARERAEDEEQAMAAEFVAREKSKLETKPEERARAGAPVVTAHEAPSQPVQVPVNVALKEDGLPDISMDFSHDNLISDEELEQFNTMRQPDKEDK
jgi:hypothetical protein